MPTPAPIASADQRQPRSWWTFRLGRIAGIPIRVHVTLLALLAWIAVGYALAGVGARATVAGVLLVAAIFAIIVVHELGHALMARRFGVTTRDILLLPIGGIASLERMPSKPRQELAVALVGPAINVAIAGLLWLGLAIAHAPVWPSAVAHVGGGFAAQLMWINLGLAAFNLLPAFPMDGGRALRAVLAMRMTIERATDVAAGLGKVFAAGLAVLGLFYNPMLLLIAVVVWFGASQEAAAVHLKAALTGVPVRAAMVPLAADPREAMLEVDPSEPLDAVLERLRRAPDAVALVVDHGEPVGFVTAERLAAYVAAHAH